MNKRSLLELSKNNSLSKISQRNFVRSKLNRFASFASFSELKPVDEMCHACVEEEYKDATEEEHCDQRVSPFIVSHHIEELVVEHGVEADDVESKEKSEQNKMVLPLQIKVPQINYAWESYSEESEDRMDERNNRDHKDDWSAVDEPCISREAHLVEVVGC